MKQSEKYGNHYGDLTEYFCNLSFGDYSDKSLESLLCKIRECNVGEILFDVEEDADYSDTMFLRLMKIQTLKN